MVLTKKKLEDIRDPNRPITYGVVKPGPNDENGVLFVRSGDIVDGRIDISKLRRISHKKSEQYRRTILQGGEILVSLVGSPGNVAVAPPELAGANIARQVGMIPLSDKVSRDYVKNYFLSEIGKAELLAQTTGSVQNVINLADLRNVRVRLPKIQVQERIAGILGLFDSLVELNLGRLQILEEIAQGIYNEWFVHFRFPGHENTGIIETQQGSIPKGWKMRTLSEVCGIIRSGGTPSRKEPSYWKSGTVDWFKTKELNDSFLFSSEEKITEKGLTESSAKLFNPGTILMAMYGATIGQLGILVSEASTNQAALGLKADTTYLTQHFLFFTLKGLRNYFRSISLGAAQQNISATKVKKAKILLPKYPLIKRFDNIVKPIMNQIKLLHQQNNSLRQCREILLPKLISGQIDVSRVDATDG